MSIEHSAKHVHVCIRRDSLAATMSDYLLRRLDADPRITIHTHTEVTGLHGDTHLNAVTLTNNQSGASERLNTRALFIMIGAAPNTTWLGGHCTLDAKGFIETGFDVGGHSPYETSCPGIFAIGDVRSGSVKRVASAVGEGSVVVSAVHAHIAALEEVAAE